MSDPQQPPSAPDPGQPPATGQPYPPQSYPAGPYQQPQPYQGQPYQPQPYGTSQPYRYLPPPMEHPQGTLILILGILGFVTSITGIVAWVLGHKAMKEIRSSPIPYSNEGMVNTGRILGMITTLLSIIGVVVTIGIIVITVVFLAQLPSY